MQWRSGRQHGQEFAPQLPANQFQRHVCHPDPPTHTT